MFTLPHFKFWCQKVLPLVYDESLSYYEVLCKCVNYINNLIDSDKEIIDNVNALKNEMETVQSWIDSFDYEPLLETVKEMIDKYIKVGVYFGLTDDGYFCAYITDSWDNIKFYTTGLDINLPIEPEYGHLVLAY